MAALAVRFPAPALLTLSILLLGCGSDDPGAGETEGGSSSGDAGEHGSFPTISASDDGGSEGETGSGPCTADAQCDDEVPFCVDGACVSCADRSDPDAACGQLDPAAPLCVDAACVACDVDRTEACPENAPVCGDDNACAACTGHDQCEYACELATGRCITDALVVDAAGGGDFPDVATAIQTLEPGSSTAVFVAVSQTCYLAPVDIGEGRVVALLGLDGLKPCITSWSDGPVVAVRGESALYMQDIRIENAVGTGIDARQSALYVWRSEIVNNQGGGIVASQGSTLHLRNSVVGGDRNNVSAVQADGSDVDVVYSTLAAGFGTAQALRCSGEGTRTIRNSILFAEADEGEIDCPDASIQQSALESAYGDGNVAVGSVDTGAWFVDFARGDLHLDPEVAAPMFAAVATWAEGDPRDDLDGDARPFVNGAMDWCGADLP